MLSKPHEVSASRERTSDDKLGDRRVARVPFSISFSHFSAVSSGCLAALPTKKSPLWSTKCPRFRSTHSLSRRRRVDPHRAFRSLLRSFPLDASLSSSAVASSPFLFRLGRSRLDRVLRRERPWAARSRRGSWFGSDASRDCSL